MQVGTAVEQVAAQRRPDVERRRGQVDPPSRRPLDLDPVDAVGDPLLEPGRRAPRPATSQRSSAPLSSIRCSSVSTWLCPLADRRGQLAQLLAQRVGPVQRLSEPAVGRPLPRLPGRSIVLEEVARRVPDPLHLVDRLVQLMIGEQALLGPFVVEPVQHVLELPARDLEAEMLAGDGSRACGPRRRWRRRTRARCRPPPAERRARSLMNRAWLTTRMLADQIRRRAL